MAAAMAEPDRSAPSAEPQRLSGTEKEGESYEQIVERLTRIVESLEKGDLNLAQSLEAFEQGVRLVRSGTRLLDEAEQRVEVLLRGADGRERVEPLDEKAMREVGPPGGLAEAQPAFGPPRAAGSRIPPCPAGRREDDDAPA